MGHMLPAFNPETDVYRLANGVDMLPSNNMLQKFSDHLWSFNSIPNFCELGAQAASNIGSLGPPSLLVGANPTETMKLRNSPDDAMQSYVIGNGYSAYNCNTSNPIGNLMAQTHQFNSSGFGPVQRPSAIQNSSPASLQERLFSGQRFSSNGGEFGENHAWPGGNAGTELLLLPGSGEGLGKTLPQSNEFNTRPSSMCLYGVNQGSLPISHDWKIPDLSSAKNELVFSKDSLSIGNNMRQGQGLSLSLSSHPHTQPINLDNMDMRNIPGPGSFGVIRTSKYVKPAQHLLDEFCNVTKGPKKASQNPLNSPTMTEAGTTNATADQNCKKSDSSFMEAASAATTQAAASAGTTMKPSSSQPVTHDLNAKPMHPEERNQLQLKKARLISMVEEVDKTYGQYKEQMQIVMTSFESAAGLGSSAPYTALARQAMSRHFRLLRDAIGGQIERICKALGEDPSSVPVLCKGETPRLRILDQQLRHQRALQQIGVLEQQPWRPQRGLPERSVSVLRAWLFEHFLHPYPKDTEKLMLARQTGLSRSQVSNWFINARVRLWKPMIEEMYVEEGKQAEKLAATGAEGTTKSKLREGDNQKESCTTTNNDRPKEDNIVKGPADVVSCSLSHANSSDSEYLSDGRPVFRVEVNDRNVGAEEWKRANTGVTLTLGLQQSNTNTQTFGGEINYQNSRISLYSHMGTTPQISSAQQQKLSQSSW